MADDKKTEKSEKSAPDRLVYELVEPFEYKGEVIVELPYRKATGRDMRKALNTPKSGDRYMTLMVELFEREERFFNALPSGEFMAITDLIDVFFARPQAT